MAFVLFIDNASAYETDSPSSTLPETHINSKSTELVILLHGFAKTPRNMRPLQKFLESRGYIVLTPSLPVTFRSLETCSAKFEDFFRGIKGDYDCIHLVGHSIGGLILRLFLSGNDVKKLGRCVLIATPNRGTELAAIVNRYFKPLTWIFRPYDAIQPGGLAIPPPINFPTPEMGAIAGNRNALLFGKLINGENDGRVPLKSVPFEGMKEFIVLPFHHEEIHHRKKTAELVQRFLDKGTFK